MHQHPVSFFSEGFRLDGDLYVPSDTPGPYATVVACSGYQGLKDIHPARFARALVPQGYAVLAFDYRGFGRSDGPRGRLVPQEQVHDVRAAVSFLQTREEVDTSRVALVGWGLGGGIVLSAAADDPRVAAVAACNGIGDGERSTRFMHDDASFTALLERIDEDRRRRALYGSSELVHPFDIVRLDPVTNGYVDDELYKAAGFGSPVTLEAAERLLDFRPELDAPRIAPRPLLIVHGANNALHSPDEAQSMHAAAGEPKRLVLLEGQGHCEWMFDDHPTFHRLRDELAAFLQDALDPATLSGSAPATA